MRTFLCLSLACLVLSFSGKAQKIQPSCPNAYLLHKDGGTQALRYASSHPLNKLDTTVTTLLVYIHGVNRNGVAYFEYANDMVRSARKRKETLVIAPQYANADDLDFYRLGNEFLYWNKAQWKDGHTSASDDRRPQPTKVSSYEVMDSLLTFVLTSNLFPHLRRVVIVGHSAGGQFVQRYSAITPLPDVLTQFSFRFIVMDPSSYLYPDGRRPLGDHTFGLPDSSACPEYNHYPKGLEDLNTYAQTAGADKIRYNMLHRDIVTLLGAKDTRTDDPNLDVTCAANLEGPYRLERGIQFFAYISSWPEYGNKKNLAIVADSGHNGDKMINSDEAIHWIFTNP
jgi:pimeloyl-ACP methyl ester carboxylesterase